MQDILHTVRIRWRHGVWIAALLFALLNLLVMLRRLPVLRVQQRTPAEIAAETAAEWLSKFGPDTHVALLVSHRDITAVWYHYRISYLLYPQRHTLIWETLPLEARNQYDFVLVFASAQRQIPPGWIMVARSGEAALIKPISRRPIPSRFHMPSHRGIQSAVLGVWSLFVPPVLGLLLLGWATPRSPFRNMAGSLALAHLVGSGALAWVTLLTTLATGRISVWPVYGLLLMLLVSPARTRAWRWLPHPPTSPPYLTPLPLSACGEGSTSPPAPLRSGVGSSFVPENASEEHGASSERGGGKGHFRQRMLGWALVSVVGLGVVSALLRMVMLGLDWDGYAIWQLKAKAFFFDDGFHILHDSAHFAYAHLDYPLLVPTQTWWTYAHTGAANDRWAQASNFLFYLDLLALFWAAARSYVSRFAALCGLAILASLSEVTQHAASGFADLPFAACFLLVGALLVRFCCEGDVSAAAALPWALGSLVLIKNEGLLAVLAAGAAGLCYGAWGTRDKMRLLWRPLALWIFAVVIAYGPWFMVKRAWGLRNDILEERTGAHAGEGTLLGRLGVTLGAYILQLAHIGPWLPAWGLVIAVIPAGVVASWRRRVTITLPLWTLAGLQLAGYTVIYLITPLELRGHIGSSIDRLVLHLVPTLLLASLLGCFAPTMDGTVSVSGEEHPED